MLRSRLVMLIAMVALFQVLGGLCTPAQAQYSYDETAIRQNWPGINTDNRIVVLIQNYPSRFSLSGWAWLDWVQIGGNGGYLYQLTNGTFPGGPVCEGVIYNSGGNVTLRLRYDHASSSLNGGTIAIYSYLGGYSLLDMDRIHVY